MQIKKNSSKLVRIKNENVPTDKENNRKSLEIQDLLASLERSKATMNSRVDIIIDQIQEIAEENLLRNAIQEEIDELLKEDLSDQEILKGKEKK
ncbi:MAG TPA: hypothetical protein PK536_07680 [Ignavibacteria bacterium]|nr:hypothetical protein [Ignavibacteria bacterium]HRJ99596.1 hypothetical protein [Ignavibacteria bacterium]